LLEPLARFVHRRRWPLLLGAALLFAAAVVVLARSAALGAGSVRGLEAERAQALADSLRDMREETSFLVVMRGRLDSVATVLAPLRADPDVLGVSPAATARSGAAALAVVSLKGEFEQALAAYPRVRAKLASPELEITCTGQLPFVHDLNQTLRGDLITAELVSVPITLLVLLLVFRTAVAALLPVAVGVLAVTCGIAVVHLLAHELDIAQYAINVCSLVGLGVAIDYSLFTVSRYREELARGHDYPVALARTLSSAGKVVLFSGLAVGTGLSGLFAFQGSYLFAMGIGGAVVVLLAVLFALTVLPALLCVLGPHIHRGRLPLRGLGVDHGRWRRFAHFVMRRPLAVLLPTLALLTLLGAPFRGCGWRAPTCACSVATSRRAADSSS
jgi:RND superfamily putative drug exporter